jgi:hypothetical protein
MTPFLLKHTQNFMLKDYNEGEPKHKELQMTPDQSSSQIT